MIKRIFSLAILLALLLSLASMAQAATNNYFNNGAGNGDYETAGNWSNGAVPTYTANYYAYIGGPGGLTANAGSSAAGIQVGRAVYLGTAAASGDPLTGPGTLNVNVGTGNAFGAPFGTGIPGFSCYVGYQDTGTLNVSSGTLATGNANLYLGGYTSAYTAAAGTMQIDGPGTIWSEQTNVSNYVGYYGPGTLKITNGAVCTRNSGIGTGGVSTLYVGGNGSGAYGTGTVLIDGIGSTLPIDGTVTTSNKVVIGNGGNATVTVSNSGTLSLGGTIPLILGAASGAGSPSASLSVLSGGTLSNGGTTTIGSYTSTNTAGTIQIDGA